MSQVQLPPILLPKALAVVMPRNWFSFCATPKILPPNWKLKSTNEIEDAGLGDLVSPLTCFPVFPARRRTVKRILKPEGDNL